MGLIADGSGGKTVSERIRHLEAELGITETPDTIIERLHLIEQNLGLETGRESEGAEGPSQHGPSDVERFLAGAPVELHAADMLRRSPPEIIACVLARGSLGGARSPTGALISRIRVATADGGSSSSAPSASAPRPRTRSPRQERVQLAEQCAPHAPDAVANLSLASAPAAQVVAAVAPLVAIQQRLDVEVLGACYPISRPSFQGLSVRTPQALGSPQRHLKVYLDGTAVEARVLECEIAFAQRSQQPFNLREAAIIYHIEVPRHSIHNGHKRSASEMVQHPAFHKAGCVSSAAWLVKAFRAQDGGDTGVNYARRAVAFSYQHRIKSRKFWQDILGLETGIDMILPFIVEAVVIPSSGMTSREDLLASRFSQECIPLGRDVWSSPDENSWHHFAGPAGLRFL